MSTTKALALRADIADELRKRTSLAVVEGFDTSGYPTIAVGAGSAGGRNAFIRVKEVDWALAKDALGLPSTIVSPHVIQLATEANFAGTTDNVADVLTTQDELTFVGVIIKRGCMTEWYKSANGTAPTVATITGTPATMEPDLYYPLLGSN